MKKIFRISTLILIVVLILVLYITCNRRDTNELEVIHLDFDEVLSEFIEDAEKYNLLNEQLMGYKTSYHKDIVVAFDSNETDTILTMDNIEPQVCGDFIGKYSYKETIIHLFSSLGVTYSERYLRLPHVKKNTCVESKIPVDTSFRRYYYIRNGKFVKM